MKTSERGRAFVAAQEGVVTRAYRDVAGVWTIGVGHTAAAGPPTPVAGMTISREEAFRILADDLPRYELRVGTAFGATAQHVFDGAVSFDFNTGAIDRATWVKDFLARRPATARANLMKWTRAGGRTVAGLVRRRAAETKLIFDADYGSGSEAPASSAEMRETQAMLAALGWYRGPIDGIARPATRAAIIAYQRGHPDLVVDGIAGPATRASLRRDILARRRMVEVGTAAAAGGTATAATTATAGWGDPLILALVVGASILIVAATVIAFRYRGELKRFFSPRKGI